MINIFDKDATVFTNNGLATLEPVECLFKPAINGVWQLEMTLPYDAEKKSDLIANDMILKVTGIDCIAEQSSSYQLFRIYDFKKGDNNVAVIAFPIGLDARFDTFTESLKLYDQSATGAVNAINTWLQTLTHDAYSVSLGGAQYWSDERKSGEYARANLISILNGENGFVQIWGGDLVYDNYNMILEHHMGTYTPVDVRYGKNILGMSYDMDSSNVVTCLYPKAKSGELLNAIEDYRLSAYPCVYASNAGNYPIEHIYAIDTPYSLVQMSNDGSAEYLKTMEVYDTIMQTTRFWLSHALQDQYDTNAPLLADIELDWIVQNYALRMDTDGVEGIVEHMWRQVVTGRLYSNTVKNLIYSAMKAAFDEVLTNSDSGWYIGGTSKKLWDDGFGQYFYSYSWDAGGQFRVRPKNVDYIWVYASSKWNQLNSSGSTTGATDNATWKWYKVKNKSWKRYGNKKKKRYLKDQTWKINDVWYWFKPSDGEPVKGSALMNDWLAEFDAKAVVFEAGHQPETLYDVVNVYARAGEYDLFNLLYTQMTDYCTDLFNNDKLSYPTINIDINFADLSQTTEYANYSFLEKIHLGDAVNVRNEKLGVPLLTERIIGLTYDVLRKCNTEIRIGLTQSSVVNLLNSIGKTDGVKYVAGNGITIENGTISVTPPSTPYLEDVIVNGNSVVRNHKAYIDLDEMGIDETIDVLYGEEAPDNEDDGEDKDFYFKFKVGSDGVLNENDYTADTSPTHPISITSFEKVNETTFNFDITGVPSNAASGGVGENIYINMSGLIDGATYTVNFDGKYSDGTTFPYYPQYDAWAYIEVDGVTVTSIKMESNTQKHSYTGTFTAGEENIIHYYLASKDDVQTTLSITDFVMQGSAFDFGDIDTFYNKYEGKWCEYRPPVMIGATANADGQSGAVPQPMIADKDKVLKGDGTWGTAGTSVEANPSGTATDTMTKIAVDGTIYDFNAASAVSELTDVELTNPADGEILKYDATSQKWLNAVESGCGGNALILDAQIYSEDEKQVGVWLDGKPLYQKTWKLTTEVLLNNQGITISAIDTSGMETLVEGCASYSIATNTKTIPVLAWKYNNTTYYASSIQVYVDIITLLYTKTADRAGSGGFQAYGFSPIIYSEEEREVGVWKDGKPLYQITFNLQLSGNQGTVDISSLNVETGWIYDGYYDIGVTNLSHNEWLSANQYTRTHLNDALSPPYIDCYCRGWNNVPASVTIRYTKTTDVAGSGSYNTLGVPNVHYSTEERVIGTWTDGKPLYQKTLKSNSGIVQNSWVSIINDSSIRIKNYYGFIYYSANLENGTKYPLDWTRVASSAYSCSECNGGDLEVIQNIATSYGYDITIQYTKTTD